MSKSKKKKELVLNDILGITNTTGPVIRRQGGLTNPGKPMNILQAATEGSNSKVWKSIADELGIKNIDSSNDIAQIEAYVRGNSSSGKGSGSGSSSNNKDANRSSGEFYDIVAALGQDTAQGLAAAQAFQSLAIPQSPFGGMTASNALASSGGMAAPAAPAAPAQPSGLSAYEQLISDLQIQSAQMNDSLTQQLNAANAAREDAERRAANMRNAFVPQANPTATAASYGDQRPTTERRSSNNSLSDLNILSGLGTKTNPLAGLQLA